MKTVIILVLLSLASARNLQQNETLYDNVLDGENDTGLRPDQQIENIGQIFRLSLSLFANLANQVKEIGETIRSALPVSFDEARQAAAGRSDIQDLKDYLDENKPAADWAGWTLLITATNFDNTEAISVLVDAGVDVNAQNDEGRSALYHAAWNGQTEIVRALLSAPNIDVNIQDNDGSTALGWAENDEIKKMLEDRNAMCRCGDYCRRERPNNC